MQKPKQSNPVLNTGAKFDNGKTRFDLLLPEFELEMAKVLTHGANTYGANSWQGVPDAVARYTAALKRHTNAMNRGEVYDDGIGGTGCTHAACIAINSMFLNYFQTKRESW